MNRNRQGWCKGFDFSELQNVLGNSFFFLYSFIYLFISGLGFHLKEDGKFQSIWKSQMAANRGSACARPRPSAFSRDLNFLRISSSFQCLFPLFSAGAAAALSLGKDKFEGSSGLPRTFPGVRAGIAGPGSPGQSQNFLLFGKGKKQNIPIFPSLSFLRSLPFLSISFFPPLSPSFFPSLSFLLSLSLSLFLPLSPSFPF